MRIETTNSKAKQHRSTMAIDITVSSLAKETKDSSTTDASRAYSDRRSGEDKCSYDMPKSAGRVCTTQPICYGYRQKKQELLQL